MRTSSPSTAQLATYNQRPATHPVVLFYRFSQRTDATGAQALAQLAELARAHRGHLRWHGLEEQVLIGPLTLGQRCARLHFPTRSDALALIQSAAHQALFQNAQNLQVAVLNEQPTLLKLSIALMTRVLPWLPFDRTVETGPEPGMGTSVMPTEVALKEFLAHPQQDTPIVMVNWLRFGEQARYTEPQTAPVSGKTAYYRYGKVAFDTLHRLRARALFVSRYRQMLIGNDGDSGTDLWHEFAMVEYPGRATFKLMTALRRYRRAMHHRQAGLAENGQGLILVRAPSGAE